MYNAINFAFASETGQLPYPGQHHRRIGGDRRCSSARATGSSGWTRRTGAATNYVSNSGTGTINSGNFNIVAGAPLPDGPFYNTSAIRFAAITDGLSNTAGLQRDDHGQQHQYHAGQLPARELAAAVRAVQHVGLPDRNLPPAQFLPPNTFIPVCFTPDQWAGDRGREWSRGSFIMASYNHFYTPNSKYPDCTDTGRNAAVTGPRSFHPGGVNMLMLDGHVQFIKDSVSLPTFRAISTRAGGEVVSSDAY